MIFRSWSFSKNWSAMKDLLKELWLLLEEKKIPYLSVMTSNISYLTWYLIFPTFWSNSVLLEIGQYSKSSLMTYNFTIFPTYQSWRHNILYLTWYLIFPTFRSHSVLLEIGQYTKSSLMIYNFTIFGKIFFAASVNYDVIGI